MPKSSDINITIDPVTGLPIPFRVEVVLIADQIAYTKRTGVPLFGNIPYTLTRNGNWIFIVNATFTAVAAGLCGVKIQETPNNVSQNVAQLLYPAASAGRITSLNALATFTESNAGQQHQLYFDVVNANTTIADGVDRVSVLALCTTLPDGGAIR